MKNIFFFVSFLFLFHIGFTQNTSNLDFEILKNNIAENWSDFGQGNYKVTFDKSVTQNGKVSGSIQSINNDNTFWALGYNIPVDFSGKKIKLTGYVKTEDITDGWAGLWMRIDPQVAFDNMQSRGIKGTTDWTKYKIELDFNSKAKTIVIGGILSGSGKIWIDNLGISVDGKPLSKASKKELPLVKEDVEFDTNSKITIPELDDSLISKLENLGKIWGFLKYYHPEIGKGNHNWDYELFRVLPEYIKAKTIKDRSNVLFNWIENLGNVPLCKSCKEISKNAVIKPDLDWIENNEFSNDLKAQLKYIQKNRHQGPQYYIDMTQGIGNPDFKNENPYSNMPYPDKGFRLLSLYRYWNIINYFFPNKHLIDKNWNLVLKEYIPQFLNAKNELEYEIATLKIIADIKDTHANLWGGSNKIQEWKGLLHSPVNVRFIENKLVVTDYYIDDMKSQIGLEIGDVITSINYKPVETIVKENEIYFPASNQSTRLRNISRDILRSNSQSLLINYIRGEKKLTKKLPLFSRQDLKLNEWYRGNSGEKSFKFINDSIGYVTLKNITAEDVKSIKKEFYNTKGIIVDIRNYPSTFVPFLLGSYFTSKSAPFVKFTNSNINYPGEFVNGKDLSIPPTGKFYKGKVIILLNELSQSQAEYTAMAFRAGENVQIIGSTTAGADGDVSRIPLPGGMMTMISGIGVLYPDGTETQRIGIIPDIEVLPTIKGIKEGRDELLEKAIEVINNN